MVSNIKQLCISRQYSIQYWDIQYNIVSVKIANIDYIDIKIHWPIPYQHRDFKSSTNITYYSYSYYWTELQIIAAIYEHYALQTKLTRAVISLLDILL